MLRFWVLPTLCGVAVAQPSAEEAPPAAAGPSILVEASWLAERLGVDSPAREDTEVVPLDLRGAEVHGAGHLPDAVPFTVPSLEDTESSLRSTLGDLGLGGDETLVLYGGTRETLATAFWWLERLGSQVRVLEGGVSAWTAAGGDLTTDRPERPARRFEAVAEAAAASTLRDTRASLGQRGFELLDLRDGVDWTRNGYETPEKFGTGHIPGALPFELDSLLTDSEGWPDSETVRNRVAAVGPRPSTRVLPESSFTLYGDDATDPRPRIAYLLLRQAGIEVQVLAAGWRGWTDEGNPVVRIVTAQDVAALLEVENPGLTKDRHPGDVIVLDNRGRGAFDASHLPGAAALPAEVFLDNFESLVAETWPGIDRTTIPVVFYCYGRNCVRSRYGATRAAEAGFNNLLWFREGVPGWEAAGLRLFP